MISLVDIIKTLPSIHQLYVQAVMSFQLSNMNIILTSVSWCQIYVWNGYQSNFQIWPSFWCHMDTSYRRWFSMVTLMFYFWPQSNFQTSMSVWCRNLLPGGYIFLGNNGFPDKNIYHIAWLHGIDFFLCTMGLLLSLVSFAHILFTLIIAPWK